MNMRAMVLFAVLVGVIVIMFVGCSEQKSILIDCAKHLPRSTTAMIGRTEYGNFYKLGTVAVRYEREIQNQKNDVLTAPVKEFFTKRGYAPEALGMLFSDYQVIYIGEDIDIAPMLKDLNHVKGVENASLYFLFRVSDLVLSRLYFEAESEDGVEETMPKALIEVGKTSDSSLYELGSVLVQYHKSIIPLSDISIPFDTSSPRAVHDFFVSKGYEPKSENLHVRLEIVRVGECVDTALMLEELRALPGVTNVHLNIFSLFATPVVEMLLASSDVSEVIE